VIHPVIIAETNVDGRPVLTDDLPPIIDPEKVQNIDGTVLDPKIRKNGAWIQLPVAVADYAGRQINRVRVPPIEVQNNQGLWTVHPLMFTANQLARVLLQYEEGEAPEKAIQAMVSAYQKRAISHLASKNGLIRNVIVGARVKRSGRAVLVPNANHDPEYVALPGKFFDHAELQHGDFIMIGRDPTIWDGSLEIVRAMKSPDDVIEMHPLLFEQLGADCDGDCLYWFPIPDTPECQQEAKDHLMEFCLVHGGWSKQALYENPSQVVDWERAKEDGKERFVTTGFSISPEQVLDACPDGWKTIDRTSGKEGLHEACDEMASALEVDEWWERTLDKNHDMLKMKTLLGPIGAASNRLKVLAGWNRTWLRSANYLSERLQQILLDSKHEAGYDPFHVLKILNQTGAWAQASVEEALAELQKLDIEPREAKTMIEVIYLVYPARIVLDEILPAGKEKKSYMRLLRQVGSMTADTIFDMLRKKLRKQFGINMMERFNNMLPERFVGLTQISLRYCPIHEMISGDRYSQGLAVRLLRHGDTDKFGVCNKAWTLHTERLKKVLSEQQTG